VVSKGSRSKQWSEAPFDGSRYRKHALGVDRVEVAGDRMPTPCHRDPEATREGSAGRPVHGMRFVERAQQFDGAARGTTAQVVEHLGPHLTTVTLG